MALTCEPFSVTRAARSESSPEVDGPTVARPSEISTRRRTGWLGGAAARAPSAALSPAKMFVPPAA